LKQIRKRLTYANVMSSIAVFLILGGATAFAASKIGANQIKANAITTGKIKKAAVTASKLKDGSVTNTKIADNAVTTGKIADSAVTGAKIASGAVTASKLGAITVQTAKQAVAASAGDSANVDCPAGQRAISGGGAWNTFNKDLSFLSTRPIRSSTDTGQMANGEVAGGWRASGFNATGAPDTILVWVLCAQ
jgi:trimeric autotransporter adhesin